MRTTCRRDAVTLRPLDSTAISEAARSCRSAASNATRACEPAGTWSIPTCTRKVTRRERCGSIE